MFKPSRRSPPSSCCVTQTFPSLLVYVETSALYPFDKLPQVLSGTEQNTHKIKQAAETFLLWPQVTFPGKFSKFLLDFPSHGIFYNASPKSCCSFRQLQALMSPTRFDFVWDTQSPRFLIFKRQDVSSNFPRRT